MDPSLSPTLGHIGRTHEESQPWFETRTSAKPHSPHVITVVFDDVGYADFGCYGSEIRTPHIDALAASGLRYSNFHTTTLCSSTRACLLTGRNHHAVGMRYLSNFDMGWPSGRGAISPKAATIAEMLKDRGYGTFAVGKWHVAPTDEASAAGPFDQWPLGRGFERFYGFMNGSAHHWHPELIVDNHLLDPPAGDGHDYHLSADLVDQAIRMMSNQVSLRPGKPFFMNLAFGAGHWPHHAPRASMDGYAGVYERGWDQIRNERFARQKRMGLFSSSTTLPPPNPDVPRWDELDDDQRRVAVRLQQAYAGFLEYTDAQLGRLVSFLRRTGQLDNTLILLISDNGAATEGSVNGTTNIMRWFNQMPDSTARNLADLEKIGGPHSYSNYPWGWAQASNTPLRLYKSYTHGGGVRDPLIVSWPMGIAGRGELRHQFHHVVDIVPTVLEVCGLKAPEQYRGVAQMPVHGTSLAYTFAEPNCDSRKATQYFEMYGHRGIWHKGWKAVTQHVPGESFEREHWELYHLDDDFSEAHNLAAEHPDKLRELIERWWAEAGKYDVMPLDDRRDLLFKPSPKPGSIRAARRFTFYPPMAGIPAEAAPLTQDASHVIEADVEWCTGDEGVLLSFGTSAAGYVLYVKGGRLVYGYNHCGEVTLLVSNIVLTPGRQTLGYVFCKTGSLQGLGTLTIQGQAAGQRQFGTTLRRIAISPMYVGCSGMPPVVGDIAGAFAYTGAIECVRVNIGDDRAVATPASYVD